MLVARVRMSPLMVVVALLGLSLGASAVRSSWLEPMLVDDLVAAEQVEGAFDVALLSEESFQSMLQARNPALVLLEQEALKAGTTLKQPRRVRKAQSSSKLVPQNNGDRDDGGAGGVGGYSGFAAGSAGGEGGYSGFAAGSAGGEGGYSGFAAGSAGGEGGYSGFAAGSAGSNGGYSGFAAGDSGGKGGYSGFAAGDSGGKGGYSGFAAGQSGSNGGYSGFAAGNDKDGQRGVVVQPDHGSLEKLPKWRPDTGKAEIKNLDARLCWTFFRIYQKSYTMESATHTAELEKKFTKDPLAFCTGNNQGISRWVKVQTLWRELKQSPDHSFVNKVVSTKTSSIAAQLKCGSCWAQASVGSLEVALKKANKFTGELSVQQLLDCCNGPACPNSKGCAGGLPQEALSYLKTSPLAHEADYPYKGFTTGICEASTHNAAKGHKSGGWEVLNFKETTTRTGQGGDYKPCATGDCSEQWKYEMDVFFAVRQSGPYIVWVDASKWQRYSGGLYPPTECSSTAEAGNHIVELLGYGNQDGVPYWLIKNSWGPEWGVKGFIKLPVGYNTCGIMNYIGKATFAGDNQSVKDNSFTGKSGTKEIEKETGEKSTSKSSKSKSSEHSEKSKSHSKHSEKKHESSHSSEHSEKKHESSHSSEHSDKKKNK